MKLVVEAFNYNHAITCLKQQVDVLIVGNQTFATRISYSFSNKQIYALNQLKQNSKLWVKLNAIFFENDLDALTDYLKWLNEIKVDRIIFQDLAVKQICDENHWQIDLHYCPETLITSYGQFDFYQKVNFKSVFLARELTYKELEEISQNKQQLELEIHGHGYLFIMHSRWKMIDNFIQNYQLDKNEINKDFLVVKEELRKYTNIIFEDNHGTHMLSGYMVFCIDIIDKLNKLNLDYLRLDFIKTNETYAIKMTDLYLKAIKNQLNETDLNSFFALNKDYVLTHNFLGGFNEILGMKKQEEDSNG